jgi:hypothetical protein
MYESFAPERSVFWKLTPANVDPWKLAFFIFAPESLER